MSLYEKLNELFEERVREGLVPHTVILGTAERKEFESDPVFSDGYRELCVLWSKRDSQISLYGSSLRKPKKERKDMSDESQDNVTPFPASAAPDLPQSVVDALVACNDACNAAAGQIMEAMTQVLTTLELTEVTHGVLPRYGHMMRGLEVALSHDLRLLLETELPALWSRKHAPQS